jgi:anti-sigma regulatory factor (Ser/Thr protein kinase)/anti-anti-sigma regulatory factor
MPTTLTCTQIASPPVALIAVAGALTIRTTVTVRRFLLNLLADGPSAIVVDLSGMTLEFDAAATVFASIARTAARWPGCPVLLCTTDPALHTQLIQFDVDRLASVYPDRATALAAADSQAPLRLNMRLGPTPAATMNARALISRACATWHLPDLRDDAELVVTELVSNAVRHTVSDWIEVTAVLRDRFLHLSVRDRSHRRPSHRRPDADSGEGGRGLLLLDALCAGWGCTLLTDGKIVWATVRIRRRTSDRREP